MQDPGEWPGGPAPPLFLDQTEAQRAEKSFFGYRVRVPGPYLRVWMTGAPLPLSQGPALQFVIVFHLNELLLIVTRLVYYPYVRNFRYSF